MDSTKFTLRFEHPETHGLLRFLASRWGVSMNRLAEDMLQRELRIAAVAEEGAMLETLELLRSYRGDAEADAAAFARAEVEVPDPAEGRMFTGPGVVDAHGIAAAFAS